MSNPWKDATIATGSSVASREFTLPLWPKNAPNELVVFAEEHVTAELAPYVAGGLWALARMRTSDEAHSWTNFTATLTAEDVRKAQVWAHWAERSHELRSLMADHAEQVAFGRLALESVEPLSHLIMESFEKNGVSPYLCRCLVLAMVEVTRQRILAHAQREQDASERELKYVQRPTFLPKGIVKLKVEIHHGEDVRESVITEENLLTVKEFKAQGPAIREILSMLVQQAVERAKGILR